MAAETNIRAGDPLRCGQRIELARGSIGLQFSSGASVRLTGPAIFEAESPMTAILTMGRVAVTADTPDSKGFAIRTRTGRIVDLGTEFKAEALPDGRCRIGVSSGVVSFHPGERGAGHLLRAGDLMEVEPGQRQVITRIERGDESPAFRFPSIDPPTPDDVADRSRGQASIRSMLGRLYSNLPKSASGSPEILLDGRGQRTPDAPPESLYFADNETGGLLIDLGVAVPVTKINVYSWHSCMNPGFPDDRRQAHRERAAQNYVLYGHAGDEPPDVAADPTNSGWTLIARVNSDAYFGLTGPRYSRLLIRRDRRCIPAPILFQPSFTLFQKPGDIATVTDRHNDNQTRRSEAVQSRWITAWVGLLVVLFAVSLSLILAGALSHA